MNNHFRLLILIFIFVTLFIPRLSAQDELFLMDTEGAISLDFKNVELKDLLKAFSIQSGLNFIASEAVQERLVTLYLDKVPIREAMNKLFSANNLTYELDEEANIITVKDWGKPSLGTVTKVFYLKYATVSTSSLLAEKSTLTAASTAASGTTMSSEAGATNTETGITAVIIKLLSSNGSVVEDARTNSLIVTDIPNRMPVISEAIAALDVPVPQVMLEVEMLDVSRDAVDKIGLEFGQSPLTLNVLMQGASVPAKFPWGGLFGDKNKGITDGLFGINTGDTSSAVSTYQIVLDFLRTHTDTKYLARPRLLILNNQTAEISITKDEVVGKKEQQSGESTTAIESTEFIRSTDLALTKEGTGIFLRVTPQINLDTKEITMVVNPKSSVTTPSTLTGASDQADAEVRETKSVVKVKDGETVVLGGLIHQDRKIQTKKLPVLGDIPILGMMFRHRNMTKDIERELLVFITPHIVKDSDMELAQAKKIVFPEREQNTVSGINRRAIINNYLNIFDKKSR